MNFRQTKALALLGAAFCGALIYPFFRAILQLQDVPHSHLMAAMGAVLAVGAICALSLLSIDKISGRLLWICLPILAAGILFRDIDAPGGISASLGSSLIQCFALMLFLLAALQKLTKVWPSIRAGALISGSTFWLAVAVWFAICLAFVVWLSLSRFVWFWDYAGYAQYTADLADVIRSHGLIAGLRSVKASLDSEYNLVPALPMAIGEVVFGTSNRLSLTLAISGLYVGPAVLMVAYLVHRATNRRLDGKLAILLAVLSMLTFPTVFFAALHGMPDIGGVIFIGAITASFYRASEKPETESERFTRLILCAGMLFFLCLFRRWYCFIVPPMIVALAIREWLSARAECEGKAVWIRFARAAAVFAAFMTLCVLAFYWSRIVLMLKANYTGAYQAYWHGAAAEVRRAIQYVGFGPAIIAGAALAFLAINRPTRSSAVGVAATLFVTIFLFLRVQGLEPHHYLLLLPGLAFLTAFAIATASIKKPGTAGLTIAGLVVCSLLAWHSVLDPEAHGALQTSGLLPVIDQRPPQRPDMAELYRMDHDLASEAAAGHTVCVAASGVVLNTSIVAEVAKDAEGAQDPAVLKKLMWLGDVDRRDGPAMNFPQCDIVVTTDPPDTHLSPGEQQVIVYLANALKSGVGIGASFSVTGQTYALEKGRRAVFYRRTAPINDAEWQKYLTAVRVK